MSNFAEQGVCWKTELIKDTKAPPANCAPAGPKMPAVNGGLTERVARRRATDNRHLKFRLLTGHDGPPSVPNVVKYLI
jgi:hypothetical protein